MTDIIVPGRGGVSSKWKDNGDSWSQVVSTTVVSKIVDVTLTLDTSAYTSGDVMSDTAEVSSAMRVTNGTGILDSIVVIDEDDQGIAFDVVVMSANRSLGTKNNAPSISDAHGRDVLGHVVIGSGDYIDLGGVRVATKTNIGLPVKAATDTDDIFIGTITRGTPTYTAAGVRLRLGFIQD
jgi:hypothetical protein